MPPPYHDMPFGTPSLRYTVRMRPFLSISVPEVPTFFDFKSVVSLASSASNGIGSSNNHRATSSTTKEQALSILEVADQELRVARKRWEGVSKATAESARCIGCEDWWRDSVKNVLKSCINANIMVATAKKGLAQNESQSARDVLKVQITDSQKGHHAWWVIPRITIQ